MRSFIIPLLLSPLLVAGISARAEPENSRQIADRYEQMLVRSPQPGTAFDKVMEWYSGEGGGIEILKSRWAKAARESQTSGGRYLILQGLLAERLRTPDDARKFYRQAMQTSDDPAAAAKLLATLETTEGNFQAAAESYRKALASESVLPLNRMEIMRSLALLYQRSFDDEKAGEVWKDALKRFPDDPYVLEEAGEAFLDAGDYGPARSAFSRLQEISRKDPFRKVAATLRLARTSELEGKTDEAVKTYEMALEETSAGSWINREVRSRIEELFRRKDDLPGLLAYYERRTAAVPQDYLAVAAQADVLDDLGRGAESLERLRSATKLAPEDLTLRLKLIKLLASQGKSQEAITEARELAKPADAPPEAILALGDLLWTDKCSASRGEAMEAWKRLAPADSKDPSRIAQLAEILTSKDETDAAILEWKRLIAITPAASDARQRLAQIYLQKGDKTAAGETLAGLVEGNLAKPENYLTLARIQSKLEWPEEARATIETALAKYPADPEVLNFAWRQALEANDGKAVADLLPAVWKSAANDFFAEDIVKRYVSFLESAGTDKETLDALSSKPDPDELNAAILLRLSISRKDAGTAEKALALLKTMSTPVRAARATSAYAEAFGTSGEQIEALQAVAAADPRMAAESLKSAARIQADSGKPDEALATLSQLIGRSPADGSLYGLYADIAARTGNFDSATKRLQEGVRYAEDPGALRLQLATFLQAQSRNAEAGKMLQEAFESEPREGRRTEIFRRQIELAMQTGTVDELIASLREKQAREQGGARYGSYLAEIFLLQGDFLSAREELAKSLGHNPDDPRAVSKLMDLADRGGDQEEGLRLSARLVELEPSRENRANYITRLFVSGESSKGLGEVEKARPEILREPADWNSALMAMRKAGFSKEADRIVEEIASAKASDVLTLSEIARLRLSQLNVAAAEQALWGILNNGNFPESLEAVIKQPPALGGFSSPSWARFQSLGMISSEIQNSLQMMFQQYRGGYFPRPFSMGFLPGTSQQATAEQRAVVRAFLLLHHLSRAQGREQEFTKRASEFLKNTPLSPSAQYVLFSTINDQGALKELLARQAASENADLETDRLLLASPTGTNDPGSKADLDKIKSRVEKADPDFAFQQELSRLMSGPGNLSPEDRKKTVLAGIKSLLSHPTAVKNPAARLQLASMATSVGELDLAYEIYDSVKNSADRKNASAQASMMLDQQLDATATTLMMKGILSKDKRAGAAFEQFIKDAAQSPLSPAGFTGMRVFYGGMGRAPNLLAQESPELNVGDGEFPVMTFRRLFPMGFPSQDADKIRAWFAERAKSETLDPYLLGLAYCDWFSGKKEDALKRIETVHSAKPTPRSAALLLEFYEKLKLPAKALDVIDLANLQKSESPDTRTLRKIRLLRAAGRVPEAKEIAEKLARGRLSTDIRESLRNELSQLGIPADRYTNLSNNRISRSSGDRGSQLRNQLSKLIADQKTDEAERMALMILQNPLPTRDDYQAANVRRVALDTLRSLKRLDKAQTDLEARLAADPGDLDAAVRLMEIESIEDRRETGDRISGIISSHPERLSNVGYAIQLLQNQSSTKGVAAKILCALIRMDPDLLFTSGFQLEEVMNVASEPESGLLLAETISGLDEAAYNRLFLPTRLTGRMSEAPFLNQLAEFCVQAGKKDAAIALLTRSQKAALANLDTGLMTVLRLAELQLLNGDKDGASATMKALFSAKSSPRYFGFMGGRQNLSNILLGMMMNRMPGQAATDQLTRLGKIAADTGTLETLLETLDTESANTKGASPSLILKTSLGRPGIAGEWRKAVLDESTPLGFLNLQMLSPVIKSLSAQKDAAKLIPALLRRIPEQQYNSGGDSTLAVLSDNLPVLARLAKDPTVKKHIALLISQPMRDPNASQYLVHSPAYPQALSALIEQGFHKEARALLDFTRGARAGRNYGNEPMFAMIEARLDAAEGRETNYQILCAAGAGQADKVFWKIAPVLPDLPNDGDRVGPAWDTASLPIPDQQRPVSLEIHAGPNPACLTQVAKTSKPGPGGFLPVTLPGDFGLLQARWKLPDGSQKWGPLTAYVRGENLVPDAGIPAAGDSAATAGFQTGVAGPLGEKSAVKFERMLPRPEFKIPLGGISFDGSPQIVAMTGWLQGGPGSGQLPQIEFQMIQENGSKNENSIYARQAGPGQWRQFVKFWAMETQLPGAESLSKETRQMLISIGLRANNGYNSQWQVSGAWDGIGIYRFKPEEQKETLDQLISRARKSASAKDYAAATADLLTALRRNPRRVLDQSASNLCETFEKAGKLSDLYSFLSEPALYLPDPLNNNSPSMNNEELIGRLARAALSDKAPPSAITWLRRIESAPLNENMRFLVETAILREEANRDPSKATPERVLKLLGFQKDKIQQERIRRIWSNSSSPTLELLRLLETPEKMADARKILSESPVPTSLLAARKAIEAWLLAPVDPPAALKLCSESIAFRSSGENSISFNTDTDKAIFARIAETHGNPGDLVAAITGWATGTRSNPEYEKRLLVETLYSLAGLDTPQQAFYAKAWADAELSSLRIPNYNVSRERVRELAKRMLEAGEWDRLSSLLALADSNASLSSQPIRQEFTQLRQIVAFAQGDISKAWPVVWCTPGTNSRKIQISWQWNIKAVQPEAGLFDTAISVAAKPLLPEISAQSGIEFLFGEVPGALSVIARADGKAAAGSVEAELPSGNGFLRAVAIVDGKRVPGPLLPVLSGKRIFPGVSLRDFLLSGSKPITTNLLSDSGLAPDGSPALKIGLPGNRDRWSFNGPEYPVEPGKFYVLRGWLKRAGDGSASLSGEFLPSKTSKARSLNMILSERNETTAQWVLYTRAIPVIPQHTFWIPFREVESIVPHIWEMASGSEIAGWELLEIDDWKYGKWLEEIALLRESATDPVDPKILEKALALAAFEPLTAVDYHGEWLAANLAKSRQTEKLLPLFQAALAAEANPLFSRPKLWRIFGPLISLADNPDVPEPVRWDALQLALAHIDRVDHSRRFGIQRRSLALAKARGVDSRARDQFTDDLFRRLSEKNRGRDMLASILTDRSYRADRPINELLALMDTLADEAAIRKLLAEIEGKNAPSLDPYEIAFIPLALELCLPTTTVDQQWIPRIDKAFQTTEKSNAPDDYMYWPALLGDLMISKASDPEVILHLQRKGIERLLSKTNANNSKQDELLRATAAIAEYCQTTGNADAVRDIAPKVLAELSSRKQNRNEAALRMSFRIIDALYAAGDKENADALLKLVKADARRFPKITAAYSKYFPEPENPPAP